jgi:hypothetical protein
MKDTILNTTFNIYLLYPVDRDDEGNFYRLLRNYMNIGIELQAYLIDWEKMDGLPKSYLYVPADHELFIQRAYKDSLITKEQIIFINCKIISECNLLILFGGNGIHTNKVIKEELEYAKGEEVPVYTMPDLSPMAIQALRLTIKFILKSDNN